jgi:hypothetical protein
VSEAKFTPGPWILENFSDADKEIFISAEGDGWARLQATVSQDDCEKKTAQANAHLIVAAPVLYEALKVFVNAAESWHNFHKHTDGIQCDQLCAAIEPARAALKLAGK